MKYFQTITLTDGRTCVIRNGTERIASEMANMFFLVVADYNPDAKRFYERNGYQQVGEIPNLYRQGITEYLMVKNL